MNSEDKRLRDLEDRVQEAQLKLLLYKYKSGGEEPEKAGPLTPGVPDLQLLEALDREEGRRGRLRALSRGLNIAGRAAIIILAVLVSLTAVTLNAQAARYSVISYFTAAFSDHISIQIVDDSNVLARPTWIPPGYRLESMDPDGSKIFTNGQGGMIAFGYSPMDNAGVFINTENATVFETVINGNKAYVGQDEDGVYMMIFDESKNLIIDINSYYEPLESVIKFAENIK
ncbi:MAG: DUF4367 domain-containing protein [Oscillospiraceae bacterium]|nr:DUF4367 domain-containing protein [Oscillospiraceae bacterium]